MALNCQKYLIDPIIFINLIKKLFTRFRILVSLIVYEMLKMDELSQKAVAFHVGDSSTDWISY